MDVCFGVDFVVRVDFGGVVFDDVGCEWNISGDDDIVYIDVFGDLIIGDV